jgi:predicted chitinase
VPSLELSQRLESAGESPEQVSLMTFIEDLGRLTKAESGVATYWPQIEQALAQEGINTPRVRAGVAATVGTEVYGFAPVAELPSDRNGGTTDCPQFFWKYEPGTRKGKVLGNTKSGDGYRYRGRGFIQLTGRYNYRVYGKRLKLDLENNPDEALEPVVAARVLASYFKNTPGLVEACEQENWREVRRLVNGGYNGWDHFHNLVLPLATAGKITTPVDVPAVRQPIASTALSSSRPLGPMGSHVNNPADSDGPANKRIT